MQVNKSGSSNGYPAGAVPLTATSTGANAPITATLPAAAGKTTYVTSLQASATGASAPSVVNVTLVGALGGTLSWQKVNPSGSEMPVLSLNFNPPCPASALNTALVLTMPAAGAGTVGQSVSIQGFQL